MGRARTEIARSLEVKVKSMLKDYQSTTTGGGEFGDSSSEEQNITDVSKQITQNTLNGTTLQDTWQANDGTLFVLMAMDADAFIDSLSKMNDLSEEIRKAVEARAAKSFQELDEATQ